MTTFDTFTTIRLEEHGTVAPTITLVAEHSSMKMIREMGSVLDHLEDNSDASIIVLKGQDGRFNLGLDFKEFTPIKRWISMAFTNGKRCVRLERMRALTISLLNGNTVGGGVQLALCTDLRIKLSQAPRFSCQRSKWDSYLGWASFGLPKNIGLGRAKHGFYNLLESL